MNGKQPDPQPVTAWTIASGILIAFVLIILFAAVVRTWALVLSN